MRRRFVKINRLLVTILSFMLFNNIECVNSANYKLAEKVNTIENSKKSINESQINTTQINGTTNICELKDNKKAAYSFTTDDGIYNEANI